MDVLLTVVYEHPILDMMGSQPLSVCHQNGWDEKKVETEVVEERSEVNDLEDHLEKLEVDHE